MAQLAIERIVCCLQTIYAERNPHTEGPFLERYAYHPYKTVLSTSNLTVWWWCISRARSHARALSTDTVIKLYWTLANIILIRYIPYIQVPKVEI